MTHPVTTMPRTPSGTLHSQSLPDTEDHPRCGPRSSPSSLETCQTHRPTATPSGFLRVGDVLDDLWTFQKPACASMHPGAIPRSYMPLRRTCPAELPPPLPMLPGVSAGPGAPGYLEGGAGPSCAPDPLSGIGENHPASRWFDHDTGCGGCTGLRATGIPRPESSHALALRALAVMENPAEGGICFAVSPTLHRNAKMSRRHRWR